MDPSRLEFAQSCARSVCDDYSGQTRLKADELLIRNLSEIVINAIDGILSINVFDFSRLQRMCEKPRRKTQLDRLSVAVSTLLLHLLTDREQMQGDTTVQKNPFSTLVTSPDGTEIKQEEITSDPAPAFDNAPETVIKEEVMDEDEEKAIPFNGVVHPELFSDVKKEEVEEEGPSCSNFVAPDGAQMTLEAQPALGNGVFLGNHGQSKRIVMTMPPRPVRTANVVLAAPKQDRLASKLAGCPAVDDSTLVEIYQKVPYRNSGKRTRKQCELCKYSCFENAVLNEHIRSAHPEHFEQTASHCPSCSFRAIDEQEFENHCNWYRCTACLKNVSKCQKKVHDGSERMEERPCPNRRCAFRTMNMSAWKEHVNELCPFCKALIPTCVTIEDHWAGKLDGPKCAKKCSRVAACDFRAIVLSNLLRHEKAHAITRVFANFDIGMTCPYCPEHISDAVAFNSHMMHHHKPHLFRFAAILRCNAQLESGDCSFKCARSYEMVDHWEKKYDHDGSPSFRFDYEIAKFEMKNIEKATARR
ncbi:hypothetical protein PENTCL1PPCAC_4799 [Pristionchus entomophagus]|uniref:C2H2-type domain-containing protein n=1 Tax=Pristionchus entomophagus TaxID=358040 RepID=A0AAV5SI84_9BILA|nr:hypothetical protein PENTCL1PPCAC_4799 [Pristionchus entomophagus]